MNEQITPHFTRTELACHHCGRLVINTDLLRGLERLRELARVPIKVHDAYRCEEHNTQVGGVSHSEHPMGKAADVEVVGKTTFEMYQLALQVPVFEQGGIGLYDHGHFIHVDVRTTKARWGRVNGKYVGIEALLS